MTTTISLLVDAFAQAMVIVYPPVLIFWLVIHLGIERWRRVGKRAYWVAAVAWAVMSLPLLYYRETLFASRWPRPWWMIALGMASLFSAIGVGRQSYRTISGRTLVGLPELEPQKNPQPLLTTGIYSRTRNPVYLAHCLLLFSAAAMSGFVANWVFLGIDLPVLALMTRAEESELEQRFGDDFRAYVRRTPRFLPRRPW